MRPFCLKLPLGKHAESLKRHTILSSNYHKWLLSQSHRTNFNTSSRDISSLLISFINFYNASYAKSLNTPSIQPHQTSSTLLTLTCTKYIRDVSHAIATEARDYANDQNCCCILQNAAQVLCGRSDIVSAFCPSRWAVMNLAKSPRYGAVRLSLRSPHFPHRMISRATQLPPHNISHCTSIA